ncbi:hypothetical protein BST83_06970 [Polaribacter filamentus]|uniref:Uncharacterized protein n=1 Tax=Polaribacter filamentus TaxID=53483 RepID=A0A2S7KW93_9FLAO|nr:hypothetical protein BST83_06970 [Polaribacter filamentus]
MSYELLFKKIYKTSFWTSVAGLFVLHFGFSQTILVQQIIDSFTLLQLPLACSKMKTITN